MLRQSKITNFFKPLKNTSEDNNTSNIDIINNINIRPFNSNEKQSLNNININCNNNNINSNNRKRKSSQLNANYSKHKICPFYKLIPNSGFAVDAFSYGSIVGIKVYFLTHFHSDHYQGLNKSFKHVICCSPITARLVRHHFKNGLFTIKVIHINESQDIDGVKVTFIDANHCPGAVMVLFEMSDGFRCLHTGDFRADQRMHRNVHLSCAPIHHIFLDTTYCDPKYDFPDQKQTLELIVNISCEAFKNNSKLLIVCGSYSIGKENVFIAIAKALKLNVWTNHNKQQIYKCYNNNQINSILVSNKENSKIHVLSMNNINHKFLEKYIQEFKGLFNEVLAFAPTGWQFRSKSLNQIKPRKYNNITIYGIPYSEHSSFTELQQFISFFKPLKVIPTVNNGKEENRKRMNSIIQKWINSDISTDNNNQMNCFINSWINKNKKSKGSNSTDIITLD